MRPRLRRGIFGSDEARGASARAPAHTLQGSVRSEQRRLGQKEPPPKGLRRFSVLASLLLGHSPTSGDAPSSRLARTENRRNKRGRIYETEYLGSVQKQSGFALAVYWPSGSCQNSRHSIKSSATIELNLRLWHPRFRTYREFDTKARNRKTRSLSNIMTPTRSWKAGR